MKTNYLIMRVLLLLVFSLSIPGYLYAQIYSEKHEESKSFKLRSGALVQITNKYGNVTVIPWEKDSVRIEVSMAAQSKQAAKVVKILSAIDCEMLATANSISARTVFYDNSATFWKDVVSFAGQVMNTSSNLQVNYTVYMPVSNAIKINNKFGNIYMDSHKGSADITLSNGDLQARNFGDGLKLKLDFGTGSIQDVDDVQLDINYSDLTLRKANTINLNSRSSDIDIEEVGTIEITSQRDKLAVKSCNSLNGGALFSRIKINEIESVPSMNTRYGELRLNTIARNFRNINIKSEYTDVFLGLNHLSAYSMDLLYDTRTSLTISAPIIPHLKKETLNAKLGTMQSSGIVGKAGSSYITVSVKGGSLSVISK